MVDNIPALNLIEPESVLRLQISKKQCPLLPRAVTMIWMLDATDMDLVREYAAQQTEPAFETLVNRHVNLVYSTALRRVGNPASAEEITQAVFVILARKAAKLRPNIVLPAWLHETTRYAAASFLRGEIRRRHREQEAHMQSTLQPSDAAVWDQLAPLLDEAIGRLQTNDRNVVVLHYFQNQTAREIAAALNIGEEAAKKRLTRAVGKLRLDFLKRGINVSDMALTGMVPAHSIQVASAALAKSVTVVALAKGAATSTSTLILVKGALKIMAWTKAKTAAVATAVLIVAATTGTIVIKAAKHHQPPPTLGMRVFTLTSDIISNLRQASGAAADVSPGVILPDYLRSHGADLQLPTSVSYNDSHNLFSVRSTPTNLNTIERLLEQLGYSQRQFHIKASFLEVPERDVPSVLAAGAAINTPNDNTAEIMDVDKMAAVSRLLRSHGTRTLAQSEMVCLFDRQMQMRVAHHVVDLVPTLLADGDSIRMNVLPLIINSRETWTAEANIWDGQTLVLGSQRSNGQTRLFLFTTVSMIDPVGNPIHPHGYLQSKLGTIPPQGL